MAGFIAMKGAAMKAFLNDGEIHIQPETPEESERASLLWESVRDIGGKKRNGGPRVSPSGVFSYQFTVGTVGNHKPIP
jgi:hypothetical protein